MSLPDWAKQGQAKWANRGQVRPPFAVIPQEGEESVWDYPRPPVILPDAREVIVRAGGTEIARSRSAVRILETASPPTVYIPARDVRFEYLEAVPGSSLCEWKGAAAYWSVVLGGTRLERVGWSYPDPFPDFKAIAGYLSFYPGRLECFLGGVRVQPQPGRFYGGWVTPEIVGPFKGEPGSESW